MKEHDGQPCDIEEFGDCICQEGEWMGVRSTPVEPTPVEPTPVEPTPVRHTPVDYSDDFTQIWHSLDQKEKNIMVAATLACADTLEHVGLDGAALLRAIANSVQRLDTP